MSHEFIPPRSKKEFESQQSREEILHRHRAELISTLLDLGKGHKAVAQQDAVKAIKNGEPEATAKAKISVERSEVADQLLNQVADLINARWPEIVKDVVGWKVQ